ncbi:MAG TPA: CBS domain-containing protein [Candidatus Caldiarchaeum subterraneum]|uniref:CBS domain-containing protein n=1 Tax=Caldiarchaeum subterraneum TaxID=311458 RepID=A0A833EC85_CALS0|nr:CBS domain-containing protein [Aigarchaeota archaeon]HIQ30004.1 CBS domain-containing protein [Candidatus Caldarchaeum subterraneum]
MPIFKRYGREITLRIRDVMSSPPITVPEGAEVGKAVSLMWEKRIGSVLVVDEEGKLTGLITERDILYAAAKGILCGPAKVNDIMSRNVITADPDEDVSTAIERMKQANVRHLPVIDSGGRPVGVLSVRDIMDAAALFMRIISRLE